MNKSRVAYLKNVEVFQGKMLVLENVNLSIHQGDFVYLIGKTGSGKSSLLKILYGDLKVKSGEAEVVGFDMKKMDWKKIPFLRRKLGIVFQDFQLLTDRNVLDNLLFVLEATGWKDKTKMKNRAEECLEMVGMKTKGFRMPFEISGGEQQRVVIARALLNNPDLILADEPTGNLDPETSDDIMRVLINLSKQLNTAMLIATHDFYTLEKYPGSILRVANSTIVAEQQLNVGL